MKFDVIIPARFASTRLPGKALVDIAGQPMIQHVYKRAKQSAANRVIIATDDERIAKVAENFGGEAYMTAQYESGTERIAQVVQQLNYADDAIIVNVQGDSPLIEPEVINRVADILIQNPSAKMATLCTPIHTKTELFNPNLAKVVMDKNNQVLYFSRAPIAWERDIFMDEAQDKVTGPHYCHLGIYAYRVALLKKYITWETSLYEQMESLEQLRVLWHGEKIHIGVTSTNSHEVNTPEDLVLVRELFNTNKV